MFEAIRAHLALTRPTTVRRTEAKYYTTRSTAQAIRLSWTPKEMTR